MRAVVIAVIPVDEYETVKCLFHPSIKGRIMYMKDKHVLMSTVVHTYWDMVTMTMCYRLRRRGRTPTRAPWGRLFKIIGIPSLGPCYTAFRSEGVRYVIKPKSNGLLAMETTTNRDKDRMVSSKNTPRHNPVRSHLASDRHPRNRSSFLRMYST